MKTLWNLIAVILLLNVLALIAGGAWLYTSGRLNTERVQQARELFTRTITEAKREQAEAEQKVQQQREAQEQVVRLEEVADGPVTVADRLADEQEDQEVVVQKIAWLRRTVQNLTDRLETDKNRLEEMKAELEQSRESFERSAAARAEQQRNEDFQMAVRMYEQLQPDQAKAMFVKLIEQGREQEVINYLASMQQRKAAAVLREFQTEQEIALATDLLQKLAEKGVQPITRNGDDEQPADAGAGGAT